MKLFQNKNNVDTNLSEQKEICKIILFSKLDRLDDRKDKKTIDKIRSIVQSLNQCCNEHDSAFQNFMDAGINFFTRDIIEQVKNLINDILDNFDKLDSNGKSVYSKSLQKEIVDKFSGISKICDKSDMNMLERAFKILQCS